MQKQKSGKPGASTTMDDIDIPSTCASKPHLNPSTTFSFTETLMVFLFPCKYFMYLFIVY